MPQKGKCRITLNSKIQSPNAKAMTKFKAQMGKWSKFDI
jgi:hypothetical protein